MTFKQFPLGRVAAGGFALSASVLVNGKPTHAQKAIAAAKVRVDEYRGAIPIRSEQSIESATAAFIQRSILFLQRQWLLPIHAR